MSTAVSEVKEIGDMTVEEMAQSMRDFSREALAALNQRREEMYASAAAPLDEELTELAIEAADIATTMRDILEPMAAAERVKRFEADQLIMQGENSQAQAKLRELAEAKAAPAKIEERRREIALRCDALETKKRAASHRAAEDFREACTVLIRGAETGLVNILDGTRDSLNHLEAQLNIPIYQPAALTAHEKSSEWATLHRLYSGRVR